MNTSSGESRRYNEPKLIGDILRDMKMDSESIERYTKICESFNQFAEEILNNLGKHMDVMKHLHPLYEEASRILEEIDVYYTETRAGFQKARIAVKEGRMTQKEIKEIIHQIEKKLTMFEIDQGEINNSLRKNINKFSSPQDRMEHTIKTNAFCNLFMQIYCEIDDLCVEYGRLLRKAPRK